MEEITPPGSVVPVYRAEVDAKQQEADQKERDRVAAEHAEMLEPRKAPLRRIGLTDAEIDVVLGLA
jgi:hypothetical protein